MASPTIEAFSEEAADWLSRGADLRRAGAAAGPEGSLGKLLWTGRSQAPTFGDRIHRLIN